MNTQEKVLDRIEQSFEIFRKAFVYLVIPFFGYYLFSFVFFGLVIIYLLFSWILSSIFDTMQYSNFFLFFANPKVVLLATIGMLFGLIYLLLYMPFLIYAIKTIWDFYKWAEKIDFKENFMFSINRFIPIMKTYWYIFAYVALIPSFIFIVWGGLFNLSYFLKWDPIFKTIWWALMGIALFLFIIFAIYRWLKTTFSVYSAVDSDDYSRENFDFSVKITSKKWWRIFWNVIVIWMIVWLLSWIASNFFAIFFSNSSNLSNLSNSLNSKDLLSDFLSTFSFFNYLVSGFFDVIINTIGKVFIFIFIYVFYKRLSFETTNKTEILEIKEEKVLVQEELKNTEL